MTIERIRLYVVLEKTDVAIRAILGKKLTTKAQREGHIEDMAWACACMAASQVLANESAPVMTLPRSDELAAIAINAIKNAIENHKRRN